VAHRSHGHSGLRRALVGPGLQADRRRRLLGHVVGAYVGHVSHAADGHARLRRALVRARLQPDDALTGTQLLVAELSHVLLGWLRSNRRSVESVPLTLCTLSHTRRAK